MKYFIEDLLNGSLFRGLFRDLLTALFLACINFVWFIPLLIVIAFALGRCAK